MTDPIRAVVFDMDGLMFDTEAHFHRSAAAMLAERGKEFTPELMAAMIGRRAIEAGAALRAMSGLDESAETLLEDVRVRFYADMDTAIHPTPGLFALLDALGRRKIPIAVATSSRRAYAEQLLKQHGLFDRFAFVLTGDDVTNSKPDPEIYLKAIARLGLPADSVLVLEDSPPGIAAARGAGAYAVGVPHEHSPAVGLGAADLIVDRLDAPELLAKLPPIEPPGRWPWLPYVGPMFAFLLLTTLEGQLPQPDGKPHPVYYPALYAIKVGLVSLAAWLGRSAWRDLRPRPGPSALLGSIALGIAVAAAWVGLDGRYPTFAFLGTRTGFDPGAMAPGWRQAFVAVRLFGLVALVPLVEELFWRSFLIRWVVDPDFWKVRIGRVTLAGVAVTAGLFAASHPEWLPALLTGLAWAWLLKRTGSVSACLASHAAANLGLGLYVLATGDWKYW